MDPVTFALIVAAFAAVASANAGVSVDRTTFINSFDSQASRKLAPFIYDAATKYNVSPFTIAGLAYTESRYGTALDSNGTGDGGYGHGIMQIDSRAHADWVNSNDWRDARTNIFYGASILKASNAYATTHGFPDSPRVGIAGYNCGPGKAVKGAQNGNPDLYTKSQGGMTYTDMVLKESSRIYKLYNAALASGNNNV
jgi:soluble lytic murein transglycosylase-like protein